MASPGDQSNPAPLLDASIEYALATDRTIDITTTGRQSGEARRIEIWFHHVNGRVYITGLPGARSWYANLLARPDFIFHLKGSVQADLPASARALTDSAERRRVLPGLLAGIPADSGEQDLEDWFARSPIVEVEFTGRPSGGSAG